MINSVYIHIPFCDEICSYCDFCKFYYNEELVDKYLDTLEREIDSNYNNDIIKTIYIGGGTPSCLSKEQLTKLLNITRKFNLDIEEFSIEANVESLTEDKVKLFKEYGINRISIGVQTFNYNLLKLLNRSHNKEQVFNTISMVKKYIDNINIDLIYAIPGETRDNIDSDLTEFLKLNIPHISCYSLIIEDNTILKNMHIDYIDDEVDYDMYKLICDRLSLNGYNHYETSNFALSNYESKHNLVYWNNEHYYGFGLSASGYIDNIRYTNTRSINNYIKGNYRLEEDVLSLNETIENEFILGFRKIHGLDINKLNTKYNLDINNIEFISKLINDNKLILEDNMLRISDNYIYLSNDILVEFMGVDYEKYI